jgi:hypothetical protein
MSWIGRRFYGLKSTVLTMFGDIKVFRRPLFAVYDPTDYGVTGWDCRRFSDLAEPGDVVLRGYDGYLDGFFIPLGVSGCSHSGVCIGDDVVHSVAEGVSRCDVLDFIRADRAVLLKPVDDSVRDEAVRTALSLVGCPYDFDFETEDSEIKNGVGARYYCHEFTRRCYPGVSIDETSGRARFLGLRSPKTFLADSFYLNPTFTVACRVGNY